MDNNRSISVDDFDYNLPDDRIAYYPAVTRDASKLLVYDISKNLVKDSCFKNLPDFLNEDNILIFNDSRVIHARLLVHNDTGAAIEIFCLEPLQPTNDPAIAFTLCGNVTWKCMVGNARKWKRPLQFTVPLHGKQLCVTAERIAVSDGTFEVRFTWDDDKVSFAEWVEAYGKIPLPPYIHRTAESSDAERYQTVYAHYDGSVAAPTAGLHFTPELIKELTCKGVKTEYVTLHVGAGTFKPVSSKTIGEHFMHDEKIIVSKNLIHSLIDNKEKRVIAVGTTVTRTLESIFIIGAKIHLKLDNPLVVEQWEYYDNPELQKVTKEQSLNAILNFLLENNAEYLKAETRLIILPTFKRHMVSGLITNFHQPKSTLLLLISNFVGDEWRKIYNHALCNNYRFLSYGDANLYL